MADQKVERDLPAKLQIFFDLSGCSNPRKGVKLSDHKLPSSANIWHKRSIKMKNKNEKNERKERKQKKQTKTKKRTEIKGHYKEK